jgi:hypothetical protein
MVKMQFNHVIQWPISHYSCIITNSINIIIINVVIIIIIITIIAIISIIVVAIMVLQLPLLQRKQRGLREKYVRCVQRKRLDVRQWHVESYGRVHDGVGDEGEQAARTVPRNV